MPIITKRMQRILNELYNDEERARKEREEQERLRKEREERERLLREYNDPVKVRDRLNMKKKEQWTKTFENVQALEGPEAVTWEESLDRKGFKVDRTKHRGNGELSETYIGSWTDAGKDVCCKVLRFREAVMRYKISNPERQLKLLNNLSHTKLINMIKIFEVTQTKKINIFMELAEKGSVSDIMKNSEKPLDEDTAKKWAKDVGLGLGYLHSIGIAHRRVTVKNILVNQSDVAKLALPDLFFEFFDSKSGNIQLCSHAGTRGPHLAPETLNPPYDPLQADVWAFGVVIFYMLTMKYPFQKFRVTFDAFKGEVAEDRWWLGLDKPLSAAQKKFLEKLFVIDIIQRPSIDEAMSIEWMA